MKNSTFLNLNWKDLSKGLMVAVITALFTYIYGVVQTGDFSQIHIRQVLITAGTAALAYLSKNLLSNSDGETLKAERKH